MISTMHAEDYISLTDMAKYLPNSHIVIGNWMRSRNTIQYLGIWETIYNPNFKLIEFDEFRMQSGDRTFTLSPKQWIESTNAIGIVSKSGRYGGTFAHKDLAFKFGSWISPEFELYLIRDYQLLKSKENDEAQQQWDFRRFLAKVNYRIQTDAIEQYLLPLSNLPKDKHAIEFAQEADIINLALFGITAKQWREQQPEAAKQSGNLRDSASLIQLTVLANMESINAILIRNELSKAVRLERLREYARSQFETLLKDAKLQALSAQERRQLKNDSMLLSGKPFLP